MALRKIKDLIREMVFDNQSDVREYANVMANLVFDRNQADEYEKSLESAENINQRYDEQIQEINAKLEKSKVKQKDIIARKKDMSNEEFRTLMANAQQEVKQLEGIQRDTIAEKIQKGFRNLSPTIKKYGCLRYLANEYVKNAEFKTEIGADGFIYADEYAFKSSSMANNFREISDYVDYIFGNRESKITEPKSIVDIIRADAKELDLTIDKLTPANIVNIYNNLLTRIAEENRNKQTEKEQIEQSQIGIKPVRDFGDGLVMYRLLPDTEYYNKHGKHRNLVYEGNQMGICIGQKAQSYSQDILEQDKNQYYTLRSRDKNGQLIPHCTIEVNGNTITQVKGKANNIVNGKYIKQVREFLKDNLNCAFPGEENTGNKRELYEYNNIGFIEDIHKKTVDLFNLPANTELDELSYDLLKTNGIDKKNIKSIDYLTIYDTTLTQKDFDDIARIQINKLHLSNTKLHGKYNFCNINNCYLTRMDLSDADIKFNSKAETVFLSYTMGLHGEYDLSEVRAISMWSSDVGNANIKFNSKANSIYLVETTGLRGEYNFSDVLDLYTSNTDLSNVTKIIVGPNSFIHSVNKIDESKIIVTKPESKLDKLNKGIQNIKNIMKKAIEKLKQKTSDSERGND